MSLSETLLPEFDEEMKNTRKILECVPDGKFDYQAASEIDDPRPARQPRRGAAGMGGHRPSTAKCWI